VEPALIAVALILSSASLVWGLIRLWQRNIARGPPSAPPEPPKPSDPMHHALRNSGIDAPGAEALRHAPPWSDEVHIDWSACLPGPPELELAVANDRAAVGWLVVGGVDSWAAEPENRGALAELGRFGDGLQLHSADNMAWLVRLGTQAAGPFDLLCHLAAAAWLAAPPSARTDAITPGEVYPVAWRADGCEYGGLPPFGSLHIDPDQLRLVASSALPLGPEAGPDATPRFGPEQAILPRAGLRIEAGVDGSVSLRSGDVHVIARLLSGSMADDLAARDLPVLPTDEVS